MTVTVYAIFSVVVGLVNVKTIIWSSYCGVFRTNVCSPIK